MKKFILIKFVNFLTIFTIIISNLLKLKCSNLAQNELVVENEFIFFFNNYHSKSNRINLLNNLFKSNNIQNFTILKKHRIFDNYPSDFDVVKFSSQFNLNLNQILQNNFIKNVFPHKKVIMNLQSKNDEENITSCKRSLKNDQEDEQEYENIKSSEIKFKNRHLNRAIPKNLIDQLNVKYLWDKGITGKNVNVAIFDTGLEKDHPHFKNVIERIDFTDEKNPDDKIGHGTFVAGLIASYKECLGLAPDANLFIFKVFTDNQVSYTSWFLDAFNYAILKKIDVLNLSIGGPDFMDLAFVKKVWEVTSNNIIMVSGIGNDGPLYGTLNNPADQLDVIGVGGINSEDKIAKFSSRGMTTWELPNGYGRVKPDIVTYCTHVRGSSKNGGCRTLSGTSVASPIVAGAITLLVGLYKNDVKKSNLINPGSIKQIIMASSDRLDDANIFEQGYGKLNLIQAYKILKRYKPQVSMIPSYIDLSECPYFWPYCSQPLYHTGIPIIVNVTILNGINVTGKFVNKPKWYPSKINNGKYLKLSFSYSPTLWPWSGFLAIKIMVSEEAKNFDGLVDGQIKLEIQAGANRNEIKLYLKAKIIPTPPRKQRILWDQFHNLRYPSGYFPRDDLRMKNDPLDWNADHLHTNYKDMYQYLRNSGYYLESLGTNFNCFEASNYGVLMIVDTEEEFHETEIKKIHDDVVLKGLSLVVFAEWYNTSVIKSAKFYEENTQKWWTPLTGGSNLPALNDLLKPFEIGFSDRIWEGEFKIGDHFALYSSGTSIARFPKSENNYLIYRELKDQSEAFLADAVNKTLSQTKVELVPILGLAQFESNNQKSGRIAVYGDSNCIDSSHLKKDCFWMLSAIIEYVSHNFLYSAFKEKSSVDFPNLQNSPERIPDSALKNYSKILNDKNDYLKCKKIIFESGSLIKNVPIQDIPNEKNFFNFVMLNNEAESEEKVVTIDQLTIEKNVMRNHKTEINFKNELLSFLLDTNFPFIACFSIILVIFFIYYKYFKTKRNKIKQKRQNYRK